MAATPSHSSMNDSTTFCGKCSNIILRPDPYGTQYLVYDHYETRGLLRASARACRLCYYIYHNRKNWESCTNGRSDADGNERNSVGPIRILGFTEYSNGNLVWDRKSVGYVTGHNWTASSTTPLLFIDEKSLDVPKAYEPIRSTDNDLLSTRTVDLAKLWMSDCSQHHPNCNSPSNLPLWIIEIFDLGRSARLVSGSGRVSPYVTLSYKWGSIKPYIMVMANRRTFQHEIPLHALPKTFADAIELTYKLGYTYLWIDALCITQDDSSELNEQIAAMQDIYSGANLTLFAATGDDADAGLHTTRDAAFVFPMQITIRAQLTDDAAEVSKLFWIAHDSYAAQKDIPLFRRGWVLQEQLLSRRALILRDTYVTWQCLYDCISERLPFRQRGGNASGTVDIGKRQECELYDSDGLMQCRNWIWTADMRYFAAVVDYTMRRLINTNIHTTGPPPTMHLLDAYYDVINDYNKRQLTYEADVLPAIAGMVSKFEERLNIKFHHGTCLQHDPGFLWIRRRADKSSKPSVHPSWSWVSHFGHDVVFLAHPTFWNYPRQGSWRVEYLQCAQTVNRLTITAWSQWITLRWNTNTPLVLYRDLPDVAVPHGPVSFNITLEAVRVYVDVNHDTRETKRVLCVLVLAKPERYYLLLERSDNLNCFKRIGLVAHETTRYFGEMTTPDAVMESQRDGDGLQFTKFYLE